MSPNLKCNYMSDYNKSYYVDIYVDSVIRNASPSVPFSVTDILETVYKDKENKERIRQLNLLIKKELESRVNVQKHGNRQYILSKKDIEEYINPKQDSASYQIHVGNNSGNIIQDSFFSNSQATNNEKAMPQPKESKSKLNGLWELISNNKLVSSIILAIILYVLAKFGFNLKG